MYFPFWKPAICLKTQNDLQQSSQITTKPAEDVPLLTPTSETLRFNTAKRNCLKEAKWDRGLLPLGSAASHSEELVGVLASISLIQVSSNVLGKQQAMADMLECLPPTWEIWVEFLTVALAWPTRGCCSHVGAKPAGARFQALCHLPFKYIFDRGDIAKFVLLHDTFTFLFIHSNYFDGL